MFTAVKLRLISGAIDWNDREVMANQLRDSQEAPLSQLNNFTMFIFFIVGNTHTTMTTICANLLIASIIKLLLFIRKLYLFMKISRQIRKDRKFKNSLQNEPFAGH